MAKTAKGFGQPTQSQRKQSAQKSTSKPMELRPLPDSDFMMEKEARLQQVFGVDHSIPQVSQASLQHYHQTLQAQLEADAILTIDEPLSWEDIFVYGPKQSQAHSTLRQQHPSYLDQYCMVQLNDEISNHTGLQVMVRRVEDGQCFTLPLHLFRSAPAKSSVLADYRFWWTHYRSSFP